MALSPDFLKTANAAKKEKLDAARQAVGEAALRAAERQASVDVHNDAIDAAREIGPQAGRSMVPVDMRIRVTTPGAIPYTLDGWRIGSVAGKYPESAQRGTLSAMLLPSGLLIGVRTWDYNHPTPTSPARTPTEHVVTQDAGKYAVVFNPGEIGLQEQEKFGAFGIVKDRAVTASLTPESIHLSLADFAVRHGLV